MLAHLIRRIYLESKIKIFLNDKKCGRKFNITQQIKPLKTCKIALKSKYNKSFNNVVKLRVISRLLLTFV